MQANVSADRILTLPTPIAGLTFRVCSANLTAADGHDVQFQISGGGTSLYFVGGLTFIDTTGGSGAAGLGVYTDNNSNDFLNIHLTCHYDITFVGISATKYHVTGFVVSDVIPTFADAAD